MSSAMPLFPSRLCEGDVIAVLSPSWGGPSVFPGVFDLGVRNIEDVLGVRVREFSTTRMSNDELYRNPRARAEDINAAFADPEIKGIFASIGGDDSVRILPYLDLPTILANPKVLMGYSDTTTLNFWLAQNGLVTFNGPSVMAGFAQARHLPDEFASHVRQMLMHSEIPPPYAPYPSWCDGYVRWSTPGYDGEVWELQSNVEGPRWLQGEGTSRGRLFGGCVSVLENMKATPFWPALEFWEGKLLFLETSEDKPTVEHVGRILRNYGSMGALERISGLLIGRARSYTDDEKEALYETVVRVAAFEFGRSDLTIVANLDFGHTDPQWILPLNVQAEIDCEGKTFQLIEAPVR